MAAEPDEEQGEEAERAVRGLLETAVPAPGPSSGRMAGIRRRCGAGAGASGPRVPAGTAVRHVGRYAAALAAALTAVAASPAYCRDRARRARRPGRRRRRPSCRRRSLPYGARRRSAEQRRTRREHLTRVSAARERLPARRPPGLRPRLAGRHAPGTRGRRRAGPPGPGARAGSRGPACPRGAPREAVTIGLARRPVRSRIRPVTGSARPPGPTRRCAGTARRALRGPAPRRRLPNEAEDRVREPPGFLDVPHVTALLQHHQP